MEMYINNRDISVNSTDVFLRFSPEEKVDFLDYLNSITPRVYLDIGLDQAKLLSFLHVTYNMYLTIMSSKATLIKVNVPLSYLVELRGFAKKYPHHTVTEPLIHNIKLCLNNLYGQVRNK